MSIDKSKIKKLIGENNAKYIKSFIRYNINEKENSKYNNEKQKIVKVLKPTGNYVKDLTKLFKGLKLSKYSKDNVFYYSIDTRIRFVSTMMLSNLTIDYKKILDNSLNDIKCSLKNENYVFYNDEEKTIDAIIYLIKREISYLKQVNANQNIIESLNGIIYRKCNGFFDSLQRILFFNQLMWQTNHTLNGLGRLDLILDQYYKEDLENKKMDEDYALKCVEDFLALLHKDYKFKSSALIGDTGQIIILGGKKEDGSYFYNDLTSIFIDKVKKLQYPDPKVLLRVTNKTPRKLIEKSIDCIKTGIGCPLFANDDIIIDKLINFGYEEKLAYNYVTAACWEPSIVGYSIGLENIEVYNFMEPFNNAVKKSENINKIDDLIELYKNEIKEYTKKIVEKISLYTFQKDTILSLLINNCVEKSIDVSKGGAYYNDFGLTGLGLGNVINSLFTLENLIFKNKSYGYNEFKNILINNYKDNEELVKNIKVKYHIYGKDKDFAINYSNLIIKYVTDEFKKYKNQFGGGFKFGLSAPSYIMASHNFPASFDGRRNGEPFEVHISSDSSNAYTELINFASKLDYNENRFNGNVVDFFVSPNFIEDNYEKFIDFINLSIQVGFFEMQMNVVSSKTLIEAKNNPEKFPDLIVRVWGFSAYFNDLPEEYKNYLIERAIKNENNS